MVGTGQVDAPGTSPLSKPAALQDHDCLLHDRPGQPDLLHVRQGDDTQSIAIKGRLCFTAPLALPQAALQGLGPTLLADWLMGRDFAANRLTDFLPQWHGALDAGETTLWLLYPSRTRLPRRTRAVIDWLTG